MKNNKGITLVALVITIIVLLILAGVSIAILIGEDGVAQKATEAKKQTEIAKEKEIVGIAVSGANIKNSGEGIIEEYLKEELDTNIGKNGEYSLSKNGKNYIVTFTETQRSYEIDSNMQVFIYEDILEKLNEKKEEYLEESIEKGQSSTNKIIGVDENFNVVNMDYWNTTMLDDKKGIGLYAEALGSQDIGSTYNTPSSYFGYRGTFDEEGRIIGNVPAYVLIEEDIGFLPVTSMKCTFSRADKLKIAPTIPNSVTNMNSTFSDCYNLQTVLNIPDGVTNLIATFSYCQSLTGTMIININDDNIKVDNCFSGASIYGNLIIQSETSDLVKLYNTKSTNSKITNLGKISN